jgi:hypothetical protein
MDDTVLEVMVQAAGLQKALADFPDDVRAAVREALARRKTLSQPLDPQAEPWPPMRPAP